jgi:hypothetical protein
MFMHTFISCNFEGLPNGLLSFLCHNTVTFYSEIKVTCRVKHLIVRLGLGFLTSSQMPRWDALSLALWLCTWETTGQRSSTEFSRKRQFWKSSSKWLKKRNLGR